MNKARIKRKRFLLKGNFQLAFITGFILLLLLEIILAGLFIYKLSAEALEDAAFSSHIAIYRSAQLITPIILKVNICAILISILLAGLAISITYFRLRASFGKIIQGLEGLKDNDASFRIRPAGSKENRKLISEYNQMASYLDKWLKDLRSTLEDLTTERDLKQIIKLQERLYSLIVSE